MGTEQSKSDREKYSKKEVERMLERQRRLLKQQQIDQAIKERESTAAAQQARLKAAQASFERDWPQHIDQAIKESTAAAQQARLKAAQASFERDRPQQIDQAIKESTAAAQQARLKAAQERDRPQQIDQAIKESTAAAQQARLKVAQGSFERDRIPYSFSQNDIQIGVAQPTKTSLYPNLGTTAPPSYNYTYSPNGPVYNSPFNNLQNTVKHNLPTPTAPQAPPAPLRPSPPCPSTPRPSTPRPSTPRPSTPRPSTPRPSTPRPSTPRPSTPCPSTPRPSTPCPSTPRPSTPCPFTPRPSTPCPSTPRPSPPCPSPPRSSTPRPSPPRPAPAAVPRQRFRDRSTSRHRRQNRQNRSDNNDELNCPTCHQKYTINIYQWDCGHSSCSNCKDNMCGICGCPTGNVRNRSLIVKSYIVERKVSCPNSQDGCQLMIKMTEMEAHEKKCPFKEMVCPLGATFGQCQWRGKLPQISKHFEEAHPIHCTAEVDKELTVNQTQQHIVYLVVIGPYNFLFNLKVSESDRKVYLTVQLIGTKHSAEKWSYEVHVYNKNQSRRKYQYTDVCHSNSTPLDEIFSTEQCATLPFTYADTFLNRNLLTYKFFIKKDVDNRPRNEGQGGVRRRYGKTYRKTSN